MSLLNWSRINLMFPCTKRYLTGSKEVPLPCTFLSCPASLPDFLPGHLLGLLPEIVPDSLPELLPRTSPESLPDLYPELFPSPTRTHTRLGKPGLTRVLTQLSNFYPIMYSTFPNFLTRSGNFLLTLPEALPMPTFFRFGLPSR
jgi:hypothetical protein